MLGSITKDKKQQCEFCKIDELKKQEMGKPYFWKEYNSITDKVYLIEDILENVEESCTIYRMLLILQSTLSFAKMLQQMS